MNKKIKTAALAGLSALALASCSSTNKIVKEDNATKPNSYMDTDAKYLILSNDQRAFKVDGVHQYRNVSSRELINNLRNHAVGLLAAPLVDFVYCLAR